MASQSCALWTEEVFSKAASSSGLNLKNYFSWWKPANMNENVVFDCNSQMVVFKIPNLEFKDDF